MKPQQYSERTLDVDGWKVNLTSYQLGDVYHSKADNVSPGACLARDTGSTREEAEQKVLEHAKKLLARTRRREM